MVSAGSISSTFMCIDDVIHHFNDKSPVIYGIESASRTLPSDYKNYPITRRAFFPLFTVYESCDFLVPIRIVNNGCQKMLNFNINGRRIYPFNKGLRIYEGVDTLKIGTSSNDIKLKIYR